MVSSGQLRADIIPVSPRVLAICGVSIYLYLYLRELLAQHGLCRLMALGSCKIGMSIEITLCRLLYWQPAY